MNSSVFDGFSYKQSGSYCVLASYAAAVWPWLREPPSAFFAAYCDHYDVPANGTSTEEERYLEDFVARYNKPGMTGYKVIDATHRTAGGLFKAARKVAKHEYVSEAASDPESIAKALVSEDPATLMVFVNKSSWSGLTDMHSITVLYDGECFVHYDVNAGKLVSSVPDSLTQLGEIGEAILFTPHAAAEE